MKFFAGFVTAIIIMVIAAALEAMDQRAAILDHQEWSQDDGNARFWLNA